MLHIWCEAHPLHVRPRYGVLCAGCDALLDYASYRLAKCPYGEEKPTCKKCPIHCYTKDKREQMHEVMRFAGPAHAAPPPDPRVPPPARREAHGATPEETATKPLGAV